MAATQWISTLAQGAKATRDWLNALVNQARNWPAPPAEPVNANGNDLINVRTLDCQVLKIGGREAGGGGDATSIAGRPVSSAAPSSGQALAWDGTQWAPAAVSGGGTSYTDAFMYSATIPVGAPAAGKIGICFCTAATAGGNAGWAYTASGWKAFGAIEE